jgi:hypothetical protein
MVSLQLPDYLKHARGIASALISEAKVLGSLKCFISGKDRVDFNSGRLLTSR